MISKIALGELYETVDAIRVSRQMTWKAVAKESGVSESSLTRLKQRSSLSLQGFALVVDWAGLSSDLFLLRQREANTDTQVQLLKLINHDSSLSLVARQILKAAVKSAYEMAVEENHYGKSFNR